MDVNDFTALAQRTEATSARVQRELMQLCRGLVPVLKDHGLSNVAEDIERRLFELDASVQEFIAALKSNPGMLVEAMMLKGPPR